MSVDTALELRCVSTPSACPVMTRWTPEISATALARVSANATPLPPFARSIAGAAFEGNRSPR